MAATSAVDAGAGAASAQALYEQVLARDMAGAEAVFKRLYDRKGIDEAYDDLQRSVQAEIDVHQVVLAWRAYDMLSIAGQEYGFELLHGMCFCLCMTPVHWRAERVIEGH